MFQRLFFFNLERWLLRSLRQKWFCQHSTLKLFFYWFKWVLRRNLLFLLHSFWVNLSSRIIESHIYKFGALNLVCRDCLLEVNIKNTLVVPKFYTIDSVFTIKTRLILQEVFCLKLGWILIQSSSTSQHVVPRNYQETQRECKNRSKVPTNQRGSFAWFSKEIVVFRQCHKEHNCEGKTYLIRDENDNSLSCLWMVKDSFVYPLMSEISEYHANYRHKDPH